MQRKQKMKVSSLFSCRKITSKTILLLKLSCYSHEKEKKGITKAEHEGDWN